MDDILKGELDVSDLADLLSALSVWEREFDSEKNWISNMLEVDIEDMRPMIPEEHQEKFEEVLEGMKRKAKRRNTVISDLGPKRAEQATMLKAKLIMIKRKLVSKLTDDLCAAPAPTKPGSKSLPVPKEPGWPALPGQSIHGGNEDPGMS